MLFCFFIPPHPGARAAAGAGISKNPILKGFFACFALHAGCKKCAKKIKFRRVPDLDCAPIPPATGRNANECSAIQNGR